MGFARFWGLGFRGVWQRIQALQKLALQRLGRRSLIVVLLLLFSVSLTGCNIRTTAARVPQLVFASPSDPSTFNPPLNDSKFSLFVYNYIFEGLVSENALTQALEPALAESWKISDDNLKVEFTLREGLKWSDGQPLTTDDVMFTFQEVYLNPKITNGYKDVLRVGDNGAFPTLRQIDSRRLEFTVPEPFAPFVRNVGGLAVLPAHILRESTRQQGSNGTLKYLSTWGTDSYPRTIVANGPYVIERYTPGQRIIFRRNPNYWRKDAAGAPLPYIDRVVTQVIGSEDGQLLSFRSGDMDGFAINPESFALVKQEEKRGKYKIYNAGPDPGTRFVTFNLSQAKNSKGQPFVDPIHSQWFNNLAFRKAVAHAIDRDRMKTTIYQGLAELQDSPLDSSNPFYLAPDRGGIAYQYDPELSKKLLKEAGFTTNAKGELSDPAGHRVRFVLLVKAEEKARVSVAAQIQQDLTRLGMKVDLQVLAFNTIIKRLTSRDWECYVGGFGGGGTDPHSNSNVWRSDGSLHQFNQGPQEGEPPITGWTSTPWEKEIDRLFNAGARELDDNKRRIYYDQFQKLAQEQIPFIHLLNPLSFQAVRDRVQNVQFAPKGSSTWDLSKTFWNLYELKVLE